MHPSISGKRFRRAGRLEILVGLANAVVCCHDSLVGVLGRQAESAAVAEFLAATAPAGLVISGERGIGKTTVWWDAIEQARALGWQVLMAQPVDAESELAYRGLADLLASVDGGLFAVLPSPQRAAIDRVLLRGKATAAPAESRAVAAAFLTVIEQLSETAPVLIAIDDVQWLDRSSATAVAYAARRMSGAQAVLTTVRTGSDASWLQLPRPDAVRQITLGPLTVGLLHKIVTERLHRSFPRPTMVRIAELSNGNPFYAIELARAMPDPRASGDLTLPTTLSDLLRTRLDGLDPAVSELLLAAACAEAPTAELIARATGNSTAHVDELLADAEADGIVHFDGIRLRFDHPTLSAGIRAGVSPAKRRAMHRRLADVVTEPELRARHLALSAVAGDETTYAALDAAARSASARGAPAAAAELLELAIGLGGDSAERRIELARHCFYAGDAGRARELLETTIARLDACPERAGALAFLGVVRLFDESFATAAEVLAQALAEADDDVGLRVHIRITLAFALFNAGTVDAAVVCCDRAVADAVTLDETPEADDALSRALSLRTVLRFLRGDGLDETVLQRALELEDRSAATPVALSPFAHCATLRACTGDLDTAAAMLADEMRRRLERGQESELVYIALHAVLTDVWRGDFVAASLLSEDFLEHAEQLGGEFPRAVALTCRAIVGGHLGLREDAERDAAEAIALAQRSSASRLGEWPRMALGFVAVSRGDHHAAIAALEPLRVALLAAPANTEIITAWFVPDAVEALIGVGRLIDAEPLITALERNGRRLDRAWMLASGARGRAMLEAACGNLEAAVDHMGRAMTEYQRLSMPFDIARAQLLGGQLARRQRRDQTAATFFRRALETFESLGTPLWADRARAELGRANVGPHSAGSLTPSERRVAELAASGMTNRAVASALFISPKTVEANLARVYRKLGIRSRAELGHLMAQLPDPTAAS